MVVGGGSLCCEFQNQLQKGLGGENRQRSSFHLLLLSFTVDHCPLHHPGQSVSLLHLQRLLLGALHGHFLRLQAVRGYVLTDHLPCDLTGENEEGFCLESFGLMRKNEEGGTPTSALRLTFLTTMLPCSSVYFSSVTVCGGMSGRSSP